MPAAPLSVVIVSFNPGARIERPLAALREQLGPDDELIVVDNGSADGTAARVAELAPSAKLIANGENRGFAAAANQGAAAASGELLVFLNPDAVPAPGFGDEIRRPLTEGRGWGAWMGLVTSGDGRLVNSEGGVVHFTGIAWAGGAGRPLEEHDAAPREVGFASGACLAIPRAVWERHGGFSAPLFLYHEDVDLSLRLRLAGERIGIEPAARVDHDYEFEKGAAKWFYLERNRWATIVRTYPAALLALLAPALLVTEVAVLAAATAGGWAGQKLRACGATAAALPRLLRERRSIQAPREITAREFAAWLTPDLSSSFLGRAARLGPLRLALRAYWGAVRAILALGSRR